MPTCIVGAVQTSSQPRLARERRRRQIPSMNVAPAAALAIAMMASSVAPLAAQTPARESAGDRPAPDRIDAVFARYDAPDSPGCALAVVQNGAIVYQRGYGSANLDYGIPNGPDMVYYVGSVSKQFTAAAVALLAEEGRISLDDDVRRYFPELPDYGRTMTIRHLIHHTSGLRDIYTLMSLAGIRMQDVLTDEEALDLIVRQKELNFLPGDDYLYSNSGYWLLGQLIERVTGESLREYADRMIFRPLGMNDTHFHDRPDHVLRNRAMSYSPAGDGDVRIAYLANFDKVGAGGLYSTLADLAKWDANYYDRKVGGPEFMQTLHTRGVLDSGDTLTYAFGNNVQQRRGLDVVRHSGSLMGFRADLVRYPTERFSVITLCNMSSIDPAGLADQVTELHLADRLAPPVPPGRAAAAAANPAARPDADVTPSPRRLQDYAGAYYSHEVDATYDIERGDDGLVVRRRLGTQALRPTGPDRFSVGSQVFTFERDAAGVITGFTVQAGRVRNIRFGVIAEGSARPYIR
jgi:CubicO group peptidase (beta-lactamase class C family)